MKEIWRDVKGYEGLYKVSNYGRIWSCRRNRELAYRLNMYGYKYIRLYLNKVILAVQVHRLVASHFIPNPENKPQVNHIDGDIKNNKVDNLEWVTQSENARHAVYVLGKTFGSKKALKICCVETNEIFPSISEAARQKKISKSGIAKSLSKKEGRSQAGGFHWVVA